MIKTIAGQGATGAELAKGRVVGYQTRSAFWLTYLLIILATVAFVISSYIGMNEILLDIRETNSAKTATVIEQMLNTTEQSSALLAWSALEFDTLENRQSRADSLLATRTWLRFMNAAFGSILIMAGAIFILSRIEMGETSFEAGQGDMRVVLLSSSPGMFMLALGGLMAISPLYASQKIKTGDGFSYPPPYAAMHTSIPQSPGAELTDEAKSRLCEADKADGVKDSPNCE